VQIGDIRFAGKIVCLGRDTNFKHAGERAPSVTQSRRIEDEVHGEKKKNTAREQRAGRTGANWKTPEA